MGIKTDNMIFVFGSNLGGIHGAGAAAYACNERGARIGVGVGHTGQSYAIPTKGVELQRHGTKYKAGVGSTLNFNIIKAYVDEFIQYARDNPHLHFQITRIGCGLAGLKDVDIAPLFAHASENCWFDSAWQEIFDTEYFGKKFNYWGTF